MGDPAEPRVAAALCDHCQAARALGEVPSAPIVDVDSPEHGVWERLADHRMLAFVLVLGWVGLPIVGSLLVNVMSLPPDPIAFRVPATFALLATALGVMILWYSASHSELRALQAVGRKYIGYLPDSELPLVLAAAAALGLLGVAAVWSVAFAAVFLGLKAVELWSSWPLHREIREGICRGRADPTLDVRHRKALVVVERYYLGRPWVQRSTGAIFAAVLLLVAAIGLYGWVPEPARLAGLAAVVVGLVVLVVIHELVVARWRGAYFRELRALGFAI